MAKYRCDNNDDIPPCPNYGRELNLPAMEVPPTCELCHRDLFPVRSRWAVSPRFLLVVVLGLSAIAGSFGARTMWNRSKHTVVPPPVVENPNGPRPPDSSGTPSLGRGIVDTGFGDPGMVIGPVPAGQGQASTTEPTGPVPPHLSRPAPPAVYQLPVGRTVAIFVKNASGEPGLDKKSDALESLITARATEGKFSVISRADVLNKVAAYGGAGANAGSESLSSANLDKLLSNETSALRLAQNMGAEYVFVVTMSSYGHQDKTVKAYGVERTTTEYKLRLAYTVLDCFIGGSLAGDTVESTKSLTADANRIETADVLNDLIDDAATKLVASLKSKTIPEVTGELEKARVPIVCGAADLIVPGIFVDDKGQYQVSDSKYRVEAMNVMVTFDGMNVGSAPGVFEVAKGVHKLRLHRDGFKDYEGTISITDRQNLKVDMQMTDEGLARWRSQAAFLEGLKAQTKMSDAEVEKTKGFAQMLRQSGFKVDIKSDLKGLVQTSIFK